MDNLADTWGKGKKDIENRERRISFILNNAIIFIVKH